MRPRASVTLATLLCLCLLSAGGCIFGGGGKPATASALPFPGPFTLYTVADPEKLGKHHYGRFGRIPIVQTEEKERGIIYARKAGFIDVAHIRESIDWTRYDAQQLRKAIKAGQTDIRIAGKNDARLLITLKYPDGWADMPAAERRVLGEELAVRGAQQLGYLTVTWHESDHLVRLAEDLPDRRAALGVHVRRHDEPHGRHPRGGPGGATSGAAGTARSPWALRDVMREISAVKPVQTELAVDSVEGQWWKDGEPLKRQFAPPPGDNVSVTPWLVQGLPMVRVDGPVEPFTLPSLRDVDGRDCSGFIASVHIQPNIDEAAKMKRCIDCRLPYFSEDKDIPALLAYAELEMTERFGAAVNTPWPDESPTMLARRKADDAGVGGRRDYAAVEVRRSSPPVAAEAHPRRCRMQLPPTSRRRGRDAARHGRRPDGRARPRPIRPPPPPPRRADSRRRPTSLIKPCPTLSRQRRPSTTARPTKTGMFGGRTCRSHNYSSTPRAASSRWCFRSRRFTSCSKARATSRTWATAGPTRSCRWALARR